MYVLEITEDKLDKMGDYVEDMLWAGGELMHCIEKMKSGQGYGQREGYSHYGRSYRKDMMGSREDYGDRYMGYRRDREEWDEDEMHERRRRDSRGRYM